MRTSPLPAPRFLFSSLFQHGPVSQFSLLTIGYVQYWVFPIGSEVIWEVGVLEELVTGQVGLVRPC